MLPLLLDGTISNGVVLQKLKELENRWSSRTFPSSFFPIGRCVRRLQDPLAS